jgi:hypothetical protein
MLPVLESLPVASVPDRNASGQSFAVNLSQSIGITVAADPRLINQFGILFRKPGTVTV